MWPLHHLIVVPGHAVYLGGAPADDASWALLGFQHGEANCYVHHVRRSIELAAASRDSLLVFSGGQTRAGVGPRSEALGYWLVAEHHGWWGSSDVRSRATTEEYARDSLQNLMYSLCRFREREGRYPERVTVVGWRFKAERFGLHAAALSITCEYHGVNDPPDAVSAERGELRAVTQFQKDPLGQGPDLEAKRKDRNPERRTAPYELVVPGLAEFLATQGAMPPPWS